MAKCIKCKKRKAKRYCPALGASLCSLCCGHLREKEIHCPPNCTYLIKHKPYQEKRAIQKRKISPDASSYPEQDILKDERMAWLALHIEVPLKTHGENNKSFTDKDALSALEYARDKVNAEKKFIIMPEENMKPRNETGEAIYQNIQNCRYEKKLILSENIQTYKKEEKLKCLERIIISVKHIIREDIEGRIYLEQLFDQFARIEKLSLQKKILYF